MVVNKKVLLSLLVEHITSVGMLCLYTSCSGALEYDNFYSHDDDNTINIIIFLPLAHAHEIKVQYQITQ